jgi:nicotinamidase-related amidase
MTTELRIDAKRAVLLVVDVQERLAAVMNAEDRAEVERNIVTLVETARRLGFPVVLSEQYKKGLGATVKPIEDALAQPGLALERFEKLEFACTESAAFAPVYEKLAAAGRDQWIVTGMETHICVYQTVRGLAGKGASVQVPRDAVLSRTKDNRAVGLGLCEKSGATVTVTETVVFDALGKAGTDDFKALSKLIK